MLSERPFSPKPAAFLLGSAAMLLALSGCDTNPIKDVHPMTNLPFASNYPIGEDGSSHVQAFKAKNYCSYCDKKIPRPPHRGPVTRGPDGEPL